MKFVALAAGACLALAVSGPSVFNTQGSSVHTESAAIVAPAWLPLPSRPFISSVEYSGEAGAEAAFGTILYVLPSDGKSEVVWLKEHLKAQGYAIDDRTAAIDNFAGADVVISAHDRVTGRRVNLVKSSTVEGASLRVTFEDPTAGTYVSLL
jgi:hypothetical protein